MRCIVNLIKKIFGRPKDTASDITTCVNSPRHANELPDWPAHVAAAVVMWTSPQLKNSTQLSYNFHITIVLS